jgi:GNAT superfamily N-acetyltransferase
MGRRQRARKERRIATKRLRRLREPDALAVVQPDLRRLVEDHPNPLTLLHLDEASATAIEPWFSDPDTERFVNGPWWPKASFALSFGAHPEFPLWRCWVAYDGPIAVGYADWTIRSDGFTCGSVVVAPEHRNQGYGTRIGRMTHALDVALGLSSVDVVDENNGPGLRFVEKIGLSKIAGPKGQIAAVHLEPSLAAQLNELADNA